MDIQASPFWVISLAKFKSYWIATQLLREASQEQDVAGGAREAAHGREALPLLHLRGRVRLQQRPRAAHAGRPQDRGQGGHDGLESQREAEMNTPWQNP